MATKAKKSAKGKQLSEQGRTEPEYMVQVADPTIVRKEILETLREAIIFMQGYEQFKQIQSEKVILFTTLKTQLKEIDSLINGYLYRHFPKGNLHPLQKETIPQLRPLSSKSAEQAPVSVQLPESALEGDTQKSQKPVGLNELDSQLKEIERQLQGM